MFIDGITFVILINFLLMFVMFIPGIGCQAAGDRAVTVDVLFFPCHISHFI